MSYLEVPQVGMQVFWYPRAAKDDRTIPRIGFVIAGFPKGVADITVLPAQDGACEYKDHVFHSEDPRLRDSYGQPSRGAIERGYWEYTPMSLAAMKNTSKKRVEA